MNNASLFSADRTTHLKIVAVSLLASIVVMVVGIGARAQPPNASLAVTIDKPAKAIMATVGTGAATRRECSLTQMNAAGRGAIRPL